MPISLVASLYKLLAKVLANRLKMVGEMVGEVVFVSQQSLDGSLVANEANNNAFVFLKAVLNNSFQKQESNRPLFFLQEFFCFFFKC